VLLLLPAERRSLPGQFINLSQYSIQTQAVDGGGGRMGKKSLSRAPATPISLSPRRGRPTERAERAPK
jgi:hypothetical protein